jgi:hypothetical protein
MGFENPSLMPLGLIFLQINVSIYLAPHSSSLVVARRMLVEFELCGAVAGTDHGLLCGFCEWKRY